jgi:hypothetical protein
MRQQSNSVVTVSAAAVLLLSSLVASAAHEAIGPISACAGEYSDPNITFDNYSAAVNLSTNSYAWITCAVGQDTATDTNDDLIIAYADMNLSASVRCQGNEMLDDGSVIASLDIKYSCGTPGGCASSGDWTGTGYIRLNDIRHGGGYFTVVNCQLPWDSGGWRSRIMALTIVEQ